MTEELLEVLKRQEEARLNPFQWRNTSFPVETPVVEHHVEYLCEAPNVADVMMEQFDYLFDHARMHKGSVDGCEDCDRYDQLQRLLLAPFVKHAA